MGAVTSDSHPVVYSQLQPYSNEEHAIPEIARSGRPRSAWARGCATVPHVWSGLTTNPPKFPRCRIIVIHLASVFGAF